MFRFTIREIFLLVVIVALALGWWLDHRRMAQGVANALSWKDATGAAESLLKLEGWTIEWNRKTNRMKGRKKNATDINWRLGAFKPSAPIYSDE
jgi:hypothetical protein